MDKLPELEPDAFVSFLEDLWNERGWDTSVKQRPDETFFIIGKRGDGKRGVLYVFPTVESHVKEKHMKQFVGFCRKKGIDVGVVATQGAYADPSRQIAESKGIHLLDRETLAGTVKEGGFEDILAEYTGGSGGPIGAVLATLQSYGVPVPDTLPFDLPSFDTQDIIARLPIGDDADASGEGESVGEPQQGGFDSSTDGDGDSESSLPGPLTSIPDRTSFSRWRFCSSSSSWSGQLSVRPSVFRSSGVEVGARVEMRCPSPRSRPPGRMRRPKCGGTRGRRRR